MKGSRIDLIDDFLNMTNNASLFDKKIAALKI